MTKHKALFISDIHLGKKSPKIKELLNFLQDKEFEKIFLVGDIFDMWELMYNWKWEKEYNTFIKKMLEAAEKGTEIYYIFGNHDDFFNKFINKSNTCLNFANIIIKKEHIYTTNNNKILVSHGDKYDFLNKFFTKYFRQFAYFTNLFIVKKVFCLLNEIIHEVEKRCVSWENKKIDFKNQLLRAAKKQDCKAVICGHLHTPAMIKDGESLYLNTGDYLNSQTCIIEDYLGNFNLYKKNKVVETISL
tara:strand:- start:618 stop:1355 length:738 start_codon:yes stop_codon:yes gene_type:complete